MSANGAASTKMSDYRGNQDLTRKVSLFVEGIGDRSGRNCPQNGRGDRAAFGKARGVTHRLASVLATAGARYTLALSLKQFFLDL